MKTLAVSTTLKFEASHVVEEPCKFFYEQRASTVIFNLINNFSVAGPFLLPANVCPIIPLILLKANRKFEFVDISPETYCIDHELLKKRWARRDERPSGLIYVRSYGAVLDTSKLFAELKSISPQSLIIDDRCLCAPCFECTLPPHTDAVVFSTGYAKYVDIGFGGYGAIRGGVTYIRAGFEFDELDLDRVTRDYKQCLSGREKYDYKDCNWLDARKPQLSWEAYRVLVERELEKSQHQKARINAIYKSQIPWIAQLTESFQVWRFNVLVKNPPAVLSCIQRAGFFASSHYESLAGVFDAGYAPEAERVKSQVINLFNDRYFDENRAILLTEFLIKLRAEYPEYFI